MKTLRRAALVSLLWLSACADSRSAGEQCVFNDDCAAPLVCAGRRCRAQCRTDRDCPPGQTCNPSDDPGKRVCLPPTAPSLCASELDCPVGTSCLANASCWRRCASDAMCVSARSASACVLSSGYCNAPVSAGEQHALPPNRDLADAAPPADAVAVDTGATDASALDVPDPDVAASRPDVVLLDAADTTDAAIIDLADAAMPALDAPAQDAVDVGADATPDAGGDVIDVVAPVDVPCTTGVANCNGDPRDLCEVNLAVDPLHCGRCGNACAAPPNAAARCDLGACGFRCIAGYHLGVDERVCEPDAPRPVAPMSTASVNTSTPLLRWVLPEGQDGARVEVCRARPCGAGAVAHTADVTGTSHRPSALPRGQYYWRLYGMLRGAVVTPPTAAWQLRVAPAAMRVVEAEASSDLDPNGDGLSDVMIGASAPNNSAVRGDHARLYLARSNGLSATPTTRWLGAAGDGTGAAVGSAGDVNGDGHGDVFVTRSGGSGSLLVHLGHPLGVADEPSSVATGLGGTYGTDAMAAGDLDGDGYGDLVVVATNNAPRAVFVYTGGPRGLSTVATVATGPTAGGFGLAASLAAAGDIDGNGRPDFVVGYTGDAAVYVYLAQSGAVPRAPSQTISAMGAVEFGRAVALADVNGDGYADVVCGASGSVRVHFGGPMGAATTASQTLSLRDHGPALARVGDVNHDGYEDVVAGNGGAASSAMILYGSATGLGPGLVVTAPGGFSIRYGSVVAGAGDIDGDGYDDVLLGDYDHRAVQVLYGAAVGLRAGEVLRDAAIPGLGSAVAMRRRRPFGCLL